MAQQCQLFGEAEFLACQRGDFVGGFGFPTVKDAFLIASSAKEKEVGVMARSEGEHHVFHQPRRIDFALMFGKGRHSYPVLATLFLCGNFGI